jgi:hypothetical protein
MMPIVPGWGEGERGRGGDGEAEEERGVLNSELLPSELLNS